ncbi:hypothetical protein FDQ87_13025 [Salmonella enterica]|uniref:Uncharacterized protein n=17 Tax=Salmonella enterica TaxID=28901 RepID=A0A626M446_SALMU|nr:hypothetical protein [Salmonella enterica]AKG29664.1 hypothetical protein ZV79_787 [Salmonella enterica subsp. enterica serovar Typhimurium]ATT92954.1 hypothetical protein AW75_15465 [Salmonella enterica subsp. enterica serovar Montevideo str. CDC 2012K-1544]AUM36652.1 hypothetical protein SEEPO729_014785 [Salmonella enterica subsp. enterica serovar Pomona str. ATCC 10729]AWU80212.1 hypothetical protein DNA64_02510 [Salmonella enterica subsp. enterica serovar Anatum]EAA1243221.1 hypothetica
MFSDPAMEKVRQEVRELNEIVITVIRSLSTEDVLILFGDSIIGDTINLVKSIKEENLYKLIETNQTLLSLNYEVLKNMLRGS